MYATIVLFYSNNDLITWAIDLAKYLKWDPGELQMSQSMRKFQQNTHETSRPDIIWTTILTARLVSLGVLLCQQSGTLLGDQINAPLNQTLLRED